MKRSAPVNENFEKEHRILSNKRVSKGEFTKCDYDKQLVQLKYIINLFKSKEIKELHTLKECPLNDFRLKLAIKDNELFRSLTMRSSKWVYSDREIKPLKNLNVEQVSIECLSNDSYYDIAQGFIPLIKNNKKMKHLKLHVQFADAKFFKTIANNRSLITLKIRFGSAQYDQKKKGAETHFIDSIINVAKHNKSLHHFRVQIDDIDTPDVFPQKWFALLIDKVKKEQLDSIGMLFQIMYYNKDYKLEIFSCGKYSNINWMREKLENIRQDSDDHNIWHTKIDELIASQKLNYKVILMSVPITSDQIFNQEIKERVRNNLKE
jgi:hypothetical protein